MPTNNLGLTLISEAQSQKHVTANEAFLAIDALTRTVVFGVTSTPPGSPAEGFAVIVGGSATGVFVGQEGKIAVYLNSAWVFYQAKAGWSVFDIEAHLMRVFDGSTWNEELAGSANGARSYRKVIEEEIDLVGSSVDSTIVIPDRAIVEAVTTRTTEDIVGATSYDCGVAASTNQFGGSLGISAGSTNSGVISPQAFYAPTPIVISSVGGSFVSGKVRIGIHFTVHEPSVS